MTPTLVQGRMTGADTKARDWAEIQERMLVPLYEAVYERLEIGDGTRLLGIGCGSGLALLMAAARGATVTGCDPDRRRLDLARQRLSPEPQWGAKPPGGSHTRLLCGGPEQAMDQEGTPFTVVTALDPTASAGELARALALAARLTEKDSPVVLAGWGPQERCATGRVLQVAKRLTEPGGTTARESRPSGRDDLETLAREAGLRPDGSGRVACPFAYPDMDSAVRGLLSTGLYDTAMSVTDQPQVEKELMESLHPYHHSDGAVRMENVFRYLIART